MVENPDGLTKFDWDEPATREAVRNRSDSICECCGRHRATDMHHRIPVSVGGRWHPSNIMHICRGCHTWIGDHPREAASKGLHLRSTADPAAVPIKRLNGIIGFLSDDVTPPRKRSRR